MRMLGYEEALKVILSVCDTKSVEYVKMQDSFYRVLAEDIYTNRDYPDVLKSAVDGFAIKGDKEKTYKVKKVIAPADDVSVTLGEQEAVFVMTGGVVPENADAIIRVEDTEYDGQKVIVKSGFKKGQNINGIGEEKKEGELILKKGTLIKENVFSVLAYLGIDKVPVYKNPKIGVFTTGSELLEVGEKYIKGRVYNTNRYILESVLKKFGLEFEFLGNLTDNKKNVEEFFEKYLEKFDILISSGGISMGKYDYVKQVLNEKFDIIVNKTKIKPGSPLIVAKSGKSVIFGMPGYPAAFFTNMILYLIPYLKKKMGRRDFMNKFVKTKLKNSMHSREKSDYFNRAITIVQDGCFISYDASSQKTSHFINFAECNSLVRIPTSVGDVKEGEILDCLLFDEVFS